MTNVGDTQYCQAIIRGWSPLSRWSPTVNTVVTRNNTENFMKKACSDRNIQIEMTRKNFVNFQLRCSGHSPGGGL